MKDLQHLSENQLRDVVGLLIADDVSGLGKAELETLLDTLLRRKTGGFMPSILPPKRRFNKVSRRTLAKYGDRKIMQMFLTRVPLTKMLDRAINVLSFGSWGKLKKKYGYDQMFHLSMVLRLDNNTNVSMEKLEVPTIKPGDGDLHKKGVEVFTVQNMGEAHKRTLKEFVDKTLRYMGKGRFFTYRAWSLNCQHFLSSALKANGVHYPGAEEFIMQPVDQLVKRMPRYIKPLSNILTDTGAMVNRMTGKGLAAPLFEEEFFEDQSNE